ncbi:glycosyl transferase family 2 [Vibrio sp. 10N.286.49.B3]|uniref:glycosyltransferase family 2 protein n=1 Tax=Vibrio sp. 10N.286.49.B3 TaxID=1880855 RepID=UPI000C81770D|nr:glycosyltransferase family 2 protein [Vibrio sp. 10N.286.49.B3]PMH46681.1 glycosyl transferase family 2 [Vibrio sp. 10N.286.49.B3]
MKRISFISPCFNEELVIYEYIARLCAISETYSDYMFEFVVVNDASEDSSALILNQLAEKEPRLVVVHLAANVGQQAALFAGIEVATGDINITIDIDLQDPPELIDKFIEKIDEGFDIVHGQRLSRKDETWFKLISAKFFYRFLSMTSKANLVKDCGDFRAFTKPVREAISLYREKHKYLRGIFSILGFNQSIIQYKRDGRHAGESKYSLAKMISLASDAVLNFSRFPIQLMFIISTLMWSVGLIYLMKALISKFIFGTTIDGWTSIIFFQVFFSGVLLFFIALIGSYVGRIFEQGQGRPDYIIRETKNIRKNNEAS